MCVFIVVCLFVCSPASLHIIFFLSFCAVSSRMSCFSSRNILSSIRPEHLLQVRIAIQPSVNQVFDWLLPYSLVTETIFATRLWSVWEIYCGDHIFHPLPKNKASQTQTKLEKMVVNCSYTEKSCFWSDASYIASLSLKAAVYPNYS